MFLCPGRCEGKVCVTGSVLGALVAQQTEFSYSETSLSSSLLTNGIARRLVGKPTASPIAHPPKNLWRNPGVQPVIIAFMVKVIVESIANVINSAVNNVEYLRSTFTAGNHPIQT